MSAKDQDLKESLLAIYRNALKNPEFTEDDIFLSCGGNSLKAAMICVKIRSELKLDVTIQQMLECKTVSNLVKSLIKPDANEGIQYPEIVKVEKKDRYPISWSQKAIYLLQKLFPQSIGMAYNLPGYAIIEGLVDVERLKYAIREVVANQDALRITFMEADGEIYQKVNPYTEFEIDYFEKTDCNVNDVLPGFLAPFDLVKGPLYRFAIYKLEDQKTYLFLDMHHLISDGVSISIVLRHIQQYYSNMPVSNKFTFIDYVMWENAFTTSEQIKKQQEFWLSRFSDQLPVLQLPYDHPANKMKTFTGARRDYLFEKDTCDKLSRLCKEQNTTIFHVLIACMFLLMYKYTNEEDMIIGTASAGRNLDGLNDIVGLFTNTLPIRQKMKKSEKFVDFLSRIKSDIYECLANQDYQFQQLASAISKGELGHNAISDLMFEVQNIEFVNQEANQLHITDYSYQGQGARFDILFEINILRNNGLKLTIEYRSDLFETQTIDKMNEYYMRIVNTICDTPEISIGDLSILSEADIRTLTKDYQGQIVDGIPEVLFDGFFEAAKQWENQIAIIDCDKEYTYADFMQQCKNAMRFIKKNVSKDEKVALYMERSAEYIIFATSLLYLGIPFIPMNRELPKERIETILSTCQCSKVISNLDPIELEHVTFMFPSEKERKEVSTELETLETIPGNRTAYILYTSGTTGAPKCIEIPQSALANFAYSMKDMVFTGTKKVLAMTSIIFDPSLLETIIPIAFGLTVTIVPEKSEYSPKVISDIVVKNNVDWVQMTPSRFKTFHESSYDWIKGIRTMLVGGEQMDESIYRVFSYNPALQLYNVYGPTEATIWCTIKQMHPNDEISIGKPIYNTKMYIVDNDRNIVPQGVVGNLLISGAGLMKGYVNLPEVTAEKLFMFHDEYVYDSGDLAKYLPDGTIATLGRKDHQIKLRGHRIEIEDIEKNLSNVKEILETAVLVKDEVIYAFCTTSQDIKEQEIKRKLKDTLPNYMIPNSIQILDKMPLTPSGKTDYKTLALLINPSTVSTNLPPQNEMQEKILECWKKIFERDDIGIQDDFFRIGGNSVMAIRLVFELEQINIFMEYEEVYKWRTIEQIDLFQQERGSENE